MIYENRLAPAKVKHIHEEYPEHDWKRSENGSIDMFALDSDFHNGPMCDRCGKDFCEHCEPEWEKDSPCVVDKYVCPSCGAPVKKYSKQKYCEECGQALDWEAEE